MEFGAKTRAEIDRLYKGRHHVELSIGVLQDGEITFSHWNPSREADDALFVYPVGSICKPFTASLLAKYVSEGKLDLHAPISAYLPDLPERYYPSLESLRRTPPASKPSPIRSSRRFRSSCA